MIDKYTLEITKSIDCKTLVTKIMSKYDSRSS